MQPAANAWGHVKGDSGELGVTAKMRRLENQTINKWHVLLSKLPKVNQNYPTYHSKILQAGTADQIVLITSFNIGHWVTKHITSQPDCGRHAIQPQSVLSTTLFFLFPQRQNPHLTLFAQNALATLEIRFHGMRMFRLKFPKFITAHPSIYRTSFCTQMPSAYCKPSSAYTTNTTGIHCRFEIFPFGTADMYAMQVTQIPNNSIIHNQQ